MKIENNTNKNNNYKDDDTLDPGFSIPASWWRKGQGTGDLENYGIMLISNTKELDPGFMVPEPGSTVLDPDFMLPADQENNANKDMRNNLKNVFIK